MGIIACETSYYFAVLNLNFLASVVWSQSGGPSSALSSPPLTPVPLDFGSQMVCGITCRLEDPRVCTKQFSFLNA